jgi:uncharacterized membrane protein YhaH (DUF805 family)
MSCIKVKLILNNIGDFIMDIEKLTKLNELKEKGVITQEEFDEQKKAILASDDTKSATTTSTPNTSLWHYFTQCFADKYADFKGRARRKEYWGFTLFSIIIRYIVAFVVILAIAAASNDEDTVVGAGTILGGILDLIWLLPSISLSVRRLHDVNLSGWWLLTLVIMVVVPFLPSHPKENKYGPVPAGIK